VFISFGDHAMAIMIQFQQRHMVDKLGVCMRARRNVNAPRRKGNGVELPRGPRRVSGEPAKRRGRVASVPVPPSSQVMSTSPDSSR
jgi:hypothetical protein